MNCDVLIVGGGVVGAACARALSGACSVVLAEARGLGSGTTSAAMGHLVAMDGDPEELALCARGLALWTNLAPELGNGLELERRGTLWVAEDDAQLAEASRRLDAYRAAGVQADLLDAEGLRRCEPCLRPGLPGGLRVPGDAVLYPPAAARLLAAAARGAGARILEGTPVAALEPGGARLADGTRIKAGRVILAAGAASAELLPELPIVGRKGHLIISERRPGLVNHQLVELGYVTSAHGHDAESIAFNLQPRPNGQLLLGSSRQFGDLDPMLRPELLRRIIRRALAFVPALAEVKALRAWTGFRPTTPDHRPFIGPVPGRQDLFLACGHEGLGITTALSTAEILAAFILGRPCPLDPRPWLPTRFPEAFHA